MNDKELRPLRDFLSYLPGRSQKTLWEYRKHGYGGDPTKRLKCVRIGRSYYTTQDDVIDFLSKITAFDNPAAPNEPATAAVAAGGGI